VQGFRRPGCDQLLPLLRELHHNVSVSVVRGYANLVSSGGILLGGRPPVAAGRFGSPAGGRDQLTSRHGGR
jgi:hypothetical protein